MRWLATATLLLTGLGWQACAQRAGAAHGGGFSARSAPSFGGGFAGARVGSFASAPRSMPFRIAPGYRYAPGYRGYPAGARPLPYRSYPARSFYSAYGANAVRRPYPPRPYPPRNSYRGDVAYPAVGYPYGSSVWLTPWELGFPDDDSGYDAEDDGSQSVAQTYIGAQQGGMAQGSDEQWQYPEPAAEDVAGSRPEPEDAVELIFKDGRAPQMVQNYMLTRTTLTIADGHRLREIPIADLDLAATEAANSKLGVAFNVPQ